MQEDKPGEVVICTYRVTPGKEAEFEALLARHWGVLNEQQLVTDFTPHYYRGHDELDDGTPATYFIEIFEWKPNLSGPAHENPAVMSVWERMGALVSPRGGRPPMEFPHHSAFTPGQG